MTMQRKDENFLENFNSMLELVPREMNVLEKMGLFEKEMGTTDFASFEYKKVGTDDMYSVARDADRQVAGDDEAKTAVIEVPFFALDKSAKPAEAQNLRKFATSDEPETVQHLVLGHVQRIQRGHTRLLKKVMYSALKGSTYAVDKAGNPRPNLTKTYQSMFEIPDADMFKGNAGGTDTFSLADQGINPFDKFDEFRSHVIAKAQDGVEGGDDYELVIMVGNKAFNYIKAHNDVIEAFSNFTDGVSLRQRLGGLSNNRMFEFDGITIIEDRSGEIAEDKGYIFPKGLVNFKLQYAPSSANGYENTVAEESYVFLDEGRRKTTVESETSLVAVVNRPDLVGAYTFSFS